MKLGDLKSMAEDLSFQYHLISRQVSVRGAGFRVYAWHPRLWRFPDVPPTSWLLDSVGPQSVVYDVGANRGYVALSLLAKQPGLRVVAFEPNPGVLGKLVSNLDLNGFSGRVSVLGIGLGEQAARVPLFLAASDSASSLDCDHAEYWGNGILTSMEVEVMTLDARLAKGVCRPRRTSRSTPRDSRRRSCAAPRRLSELTGPSYSWRSMRNRRGAITTRPFSVRLPVMPTG